MKNKKIQWWATKISKKEIEGVVDTIANGNISMGPITEQFEKRIAEILNVPYAIATTSCSIALLMAMMALGIKKGDEVIISNRTFIATAHAPLFLGAKVVLVDVKKDKPLMDIMEVKSKINSNTKAIIPVHLCGRCEDMKSILDIARQYGLYVIEDAAQAMFSRCDLGYLGTLGDIGCFSLGLTKLITTGFGGIVVTKDKDIERRLRRIRNHGIGKDGDRLDMLGNNFKYSDMMAMIGLGQLKRAKEKIRKIKEIYLKYVRSFEKLNSIKLIPVDVESGEIPLWVEALVDKRDTLMDYLDKNGIVTRAFHPNLNNSPHICRSGVYPKSDRFASEGLILPCGPDQPLSNVERVINSIKYYENKR